jgi:hypothetical protein
MLGALVVLAGLPTAASAFPPNGGSEQSTGTAPAGGALLTQTDDIPANATQGSFEVQPLPGADAHDFDEVTATLVETFPNLGKLSKRSQAVLACAFLSYLPFGSGPEGGPITFHHVELQVMLLNICLRMALSIPNPPPARDRASSATGACGQISRAVPVVITHARAGYTGVVSGKLRPVTRPGLAVSCRRKGKGLLLSVRPKKRGQTLRQAGGPTLAIAYKNPTASSVGIRTTFKAN